MLLVYVAPEVYGTEAMSDSKVRKWVCKIKSGHTNVHHEECSGQSSLITDYLMQAVKIKNSESRRSDNHSFIGISIRFSVGGVFKIMNEALNFKKLCSQWLQRLLTEKYKDKRFASSLDFMIRYEEVGDNMLSRIVIGDETRVSHITTESKQQSTEWQIHPLPSRSKPNKLCQSVRLWQ
ncbi:uncharacterized protein TNCV_2662961 [Trichonephila clavipes]|nr:uncharacterized protein TNCV_2662961 [Trichonephila clavipes]